MFFCFIILKIKVEVLYIYIFTNTILSDILKTKFSRNWLHKKC